jgi:hypothetical protein
MKKEELAGKTVADLKALAKRKKVPLPSGATKADIIALLVKAGAAVNVSTIAGKAKKAPAGTKKAASTKSGKKKAAVKKTAVKKAAALRKKAAVKGAAAPSVPSAGEAGAWQMPPGAYEPLMAQERVEDAKYFTGPPERQRGGLRALPAEYGAERVSLLARDPDTVFCFWEVPQERLVQERSRIGQEGRLCLRIYDVTGVQFDGSNATSFFDQEVYERIGSWYFDLKRPTHTFVADIGLRGPDGRFRTIARSPVLVTPPGGVSDIVEKEWTLGETELVKLYGLSAGQTGGASSELIQELIHRRRRGDISSPGVSSWGAGGPKRK